MEYQSLQEGHVVALREATLPDGTIPSRTRFMQANACSLPLQALGTFDAVLASNVLCRCVTEHKLTGLVKDFRFRA